MPAKYRMAVRKSPPRDPQQFTLYRMESEMIGARGYAKMTQSDIKRFARSLCANYSVQQADIQFVDIGPWSGASYPDGTIKLNPNRNRSRDLITVAHELAHHVHTFIAPGHKHQDHGPEFLGVYMSVLDTTRIIPVISMRPLLDHYKLAYCDPGTRNSLTELKRAVLGRS